MKFILVKITTNSSFIVNIIQNILNNGLYSADLSLSFYVYNDFKTKLNTT